MASRAGAVRLKSAIALRLSAFSAALYIPIGLYLPFYPVWLAARGLSDSQIALCLSAPLIGRVALMPIIAYVADKRGIAATLGVCACAMTGAYFALNFAHGFAPIFAGSVLAIAMQGSLPALNDALALAEIRRFEKIGLREMQYGRIRVCASLSALATMLLSGLIVRLFPGNRIIVALSLLALFPALAGIAMALTFRKVWLAFSQSGLTEDPANLGLAIIVMVAAALVLASHSEIYAFGTLQWKAMGIPASVIGVAWAIGVMSESLVFIFGGRFLGGSRNALSFLLLGAAGAIVRWLVMSSGPSTPIILGLQLMHGFSFAATYIGGVLFLGTLAGPNHRARMQGWFSAATALSMALTTFACGRLTSLYGAGAYVAMAGLAGLGFALLCYARVLTRMRA